MKYTDTVLQTKDIKWKRPKIKVIEDGKVDFILTIPMTDILKKQAYRSFNYGILALLKFVIENEDIEKEEFRDKLEKQIAEWKLV